PTTSTYTHYRRIRTPLLSGRSPSTRSSVATGSHRPCSMSWPIGPALSAWRRRSPMTMRPRIACSRHSPSSAGQVATVVRCSLRRCTRTATTRNTSTRSHPRNEPHPGSARSLTAKHWVEVLREFSDSAPGAGALTYGPDRPAVMTPLIESLQSGALLLSTDPKPPVKRDFLVTFQDLILSPRGLDFFRMST